MEFIKYIYSDFFSTGMDYYYADASNVKMNILGNFLTADVRSQADFFKNWLFDPKAEVSSSNETFLEKDNGNILISDLYPDEEYEDVEVKMTGEQFLKLLDDWDKVYKLKPREVIIKHENDQFILETKD